MARFAIGTIAQLSGKLTLNGHTLGQPELSVLTRLLGGDKPDSIFRKVGEIRKEGERGRPAIIWSVDTETAAWVELGNDTAGLSLTEEQPPLFAREAA